MLLATIHSRVGELLQLEEFLLDLWGGVGGIGEDETACGTGVLPWDGVTTELLEELFFIRMEE